MSDAIKQIIAATSKCYSNNEEEFNHNSFEDAAEALFCCSDDKVGDIVSIWEGDPVHQPASNFVPSMGDLLKEQAWEQMRENADGWEFGKEDEKLLQEAVEKAVDAWADERKLQPLFYSVTNIKELKVRLTSEEGDCELVDLAQIQKEQKP